MTVTQLPPEHPDYGKRRKIPPRTRQAVIERDGFICGICDQPIRGSDTLHIDHVVPVCAGGTNDPKNLRPAHADCNIRRHTGGYRAEHNRPAPSVAIQVGRLYERIRRERGYPDHLELPGGGTWRPSWYSPLDLLIAQAEAQGRVDAAGERRPA